MSFLAPLFLVGALAVAAPVIFHLIRRTSREKTTFSSLMFLQPTPPRVTRSSKLENIFLLLLRCLVLCLLALGFARPFVQRPVAADKERGEGERMVVLIDSSASMRRDGLWAEARTKAEQVLRRATPADAVEIQLFDRASRPLLSFEQWNATPAPERVTTALQRLADTQPGWAGTHLGNAMLGAVEALEDNSAKGTAAAPGARRIVVITDLQEGAKLDGLQGFEWPRGIEVTIEPLKAKRPTNAGLQLLHEQDETQKPSGENELKLRVVNSTDAKREQFQVGWSTPGQRGFIGTPIDTYVPPGQSRVFAAPKPPTNAPAVRLMLTGDEEEFDNTANVVAARPETIKVLYIGNDDPRDSQQLLYYLKRAFPETRRQSVQIIARSANAAVPDEDLFAAPIAVIGDALAAEASRSVRGFLDSGKPAIAVLKSTATAPTLAQLAGLGTVAAEEANEGTHALLGNVDLEHPVFAPFADPRFSDFTKIHFWKHRKLDPAQFKGARVLARFDKGDPALLQVPAGKGTLYVFTSGWHPTDSQLALASKFVPLLFSFLEVSGGVRAQFAQYIIGDSVNLPATNATQTILVRKPDGSEAKVAGGTRFAGTDLPGVYTVISGVATQQFAVNLDSSESRTAALSLEELERLRLPVKSTDVASIKAAEQKKLQLQASELEQRQKLWRWLLVAALVILLMETWLAGWLTRRGTAPAQA